MPLPPSAVPLADDGESGLIRQLVFLPDGKRVATISADAADGVYRARVYDANTGTLQRTLSGPGESTNDGQWCIAALGGEVVVTGSVINDTAGLLSFALSFWHAATGRRLHLSIQYSPIHAIAVLDSSRFVTGAHDGALAFHRHRGGEDVVVLQTFLNAFFPKKISGWLDAGKRIAAHGRKMVCVSGDKTVEAWNVDRMEVCGTLSGHAECVTGVALGAEHILTTTDGGSRLNIYIWDAVSCSSLHRLHVKCQSPSRYPIIFADSHVLTISEEGGLVLTELATGVSAHRVEMDIGVSGVAMAPDGRIALGYSEDCESWTGAILQAPPPVAQIVRARVASAVAVADQPKPIKEMFAKLCAGDICADEAVATVINPDACAANLSEFLHAHHLALVAVKRGGVPGMTSFSFTERSMDSEGGTTVTTTRTFGGPNWWFLNLYCSARKLQLSAVALRMVQSCFAEAAEAGLIEGTEGALSTIVARDDLRQGMEVMQSGAIRICRMLADLQNCQLELQDKLSTLQSGQSQLEDTFSTLLSGQAAAEKDLVVKKKQLEALAVAFGRFKEQRAVGHLVGFGLHIIPFVGDAFAKAASGAAAVGDLTNDLLGTGVGMIGEAQNFIADRIFVKAGKSVESLGSRGKTEAQLVAKLGIGGVSELQQMFVQGRGNICTLSESDVAVEFELIVQEFSGILAVAKDQTSDMDGPSLVDIGDSDCRRVDDGSANVGSSVGERRSDGDSGAGSTSIARMPDFAALKLARREIGVADLEKMLDWELVQLLAGDLVSFNPRHADRFQRINASLTTALEILEVFAGDDLLGEHSCVDSETFLEGVMEQLDRDGLVGPTTRTRLERLMAKFSGE